MTRRKFTAALAGAPAILRSAETLQEHGKRVIAQCINALGGDAFRQMPGRLETGRAYHFYNDEINGLAPAKIYTKYLDAGAPFREVQRQVLGKKDDESIILSAKEGWDITYRGAEPIDQSTLDEWHDRLLTDIFYILRARLDEPNMSLFYRGKDVVENQPTEIVDYYDADNRNVTFWINSVTLLPTRQLVKRWDATYKERREEMTRFNTYQDAGNGVMWPHEIQRTRDEEKISQVISDSVKIDNFADSLFQLPPNVKILKKK